MGTEVGRAAGLYQGSNTEQGIGVPSQLRFAPCGCFFLVEPGSQTAGIFSFSPVCAACSPPDEGSPITLGGTAAASPLPEHAVAESCCLQVVLVWCLAPALSGFRNILLNSPMKYRN